MSAGRRGAVVFRASARRPEEHVAFDYRRGAWAQLRGWGSVRQCGLPSKLVGARLAAPRARAGRATRETQQPLDAIHRRRFPWVVEERQRATARATARLARERRAGDESRATNRTRRPLHSASG
jgi:hypothetical protein